MPDKDQGSFINGFSLGIFAGAVGYFLFGTDKGKSFREDVSKEWDLAKDKLVEEGLIENKDATLREVINDFVSRVLGENKAQELIPTSKTKKAEKAKNKKTKAKSKKTSKSKKKFKGV